MSNPSRDGMTGPHAAYAPGFRAALMRQGYARQVVTDQLRLMAQLSHWLECEKAGINELTAKGLVKSCREQCSGLVSQADTCAYELR